MAMEGQVNTGLAPRTSDFPDENDRYLRAPSPKAPLIPGPPRKDAEWTEGKKSETERKAQKYTASASFLKSCSELPIFENDQ